MLRNLVILLAVVLLPALAQAQMSSYQLLIREDPAASEPLSEKAKQEVAKIAVERLDARLKKARVKHVRVERKGVSTIEVTAGGDHGRGWMEALLTAKGRMTVRLPAVRATDWLKIASELPEGVEIRGAEQPHLWSASRQQLEQAIGKLAVVERLLVVAPAEGGGWRALELGPPLATEKDVQEVHSRRSDTGHAFVSIGMSPGARAKLAAATPTGVQRLAVVLDGELAGFAPMRSLEGGTIELVAPDTLRSRKARAAWADQVAGRLAAPLPISMAVLTE